MTVGIYHIACLSRGFGWRWHAVRGSAPRSGPVAWPGVGLVIITGKAGDYLVIHGLRPLRKGVCRLWVLLSLYWSKYSSAVFATPCPLLGNQQAPDAWIL